MHIVYENELNTNGKLPFDLFIEYEKMNNFTTLTVNSLIGDFLGYVELFDDKITRREQEEAFDVEAGYPLPDDPARSYTDKEINEAIQLAITFISDNLKGVK